ncbi:MAG TPA: alpha/beta hydrolase [Thermomicrobiales bacterium]|nr:alpha/beta hydrolase [Thermomicrobiales bacterium]
MARVGDLDVAYDIAGPEGGTPILMINGLGADRAAWGLQVPAFRQEFRTIAYDNRDVGQTGAGRAPRPYGIRQFADDAAGLLDALGIARAHIVGASMGGAIAQEFGLAYPERAESLTIICAWAKTDPWLAELLRHWETVFDAHGPLAWTRASWLWVFTYRFYDADPANLANLLATTAADPAPQSAAMYRRQSHAAAAHDALERLGGIASPTHVVAGAEDQLTPLRFSEEIAAAIPGAQLSVMPNVGHGMFWEATEAFNDLVLGFIRDGG